MAQIDYTWWCDASLPEHPKVHRLAEVLKISELEAIGVIVSLLCRVRRHVPSGDLSGVPERTIAIWGGLKRVTFAALIESGWLDQGRTVHGWAERYAAVDARRARDVERKRQLRAQVEDAARGRRADGAGNEVERRADGARTALEMRWNGARTARGRRAPGAGEGKGDGEGDEERERGSEVGNVGKFSGPPATSPAAPPSPFFRIYQGKSARTNVLRRSDELRTTLGERLAPFADRVAEVIATRAERASNPESYTTSAVNKDWCREIASRLEAADADAAEAASRVEVGGPSEPRRGGAASVSLEELIGLIPGGAA